MCDPLVVTDSVAAAARRWPAFGHCCLMLIAMFALIATGCGEDQAGHVASGGAKRELIVFHAGSLSVPFKELSQLFERQNPGVTVKAEAAGSRSSARKISDLQRLCDVMGSADYSVIENLLMPDHASFCVRFATNEMGIAYTSESNMAGRVDTHNWPQLLLGDELIFGRADPNSDPCGYRTVMVFQLAEAYYATPGLAKKLAAKHDRRYIRPKETDLLALLEAGEIDYLFIYRSVAKQHHLEFIELPDEINLKSAAHAERYATARVAVSGKKPGQTIDRQGAPIVYGVTIPNNAPNRDLAVAYVKLLLSPQGQAVMEHNGQTPLRPAISSDIATVPESLRAFCQAPGVP